MTDTVLYVQYSVYDSIYVYVYLFIPYVFMEVVSCTFPAEHKEKKCLFIFGGLMILIDEVILLI